jgi:hypothetical protein
VFRRAKVARRKRKLVRKIRIQEKWTAEGTGRRPQRGDPPRKSVTAQGTRSQEIRPVECSTENPERTDVRDKTLERPGMQQWHKGPRPKAATTR